MVKKMSRSFESLKASVSLETVLLLDFEKLFEVYTDTSNKAVRGVLVQEGHPISNCLWKLEAKRDKIEIFHPWKEDVGGGVLPSNGATLLTGYQVCGEYK